MPDAKEKRMQTVDQRLTRHAATSLALLLAAIAVFSCGGSGGGGNGARDHLKKEYQRDPAAYKKKWGV